MSSQSDAFDYAARMWLYRHGIKNPTQDHIEVLRLLCFEQENEFLYSEELLYLNSAEIINLNLTAHGEEIKDAADKQCVDINTVKNYRRNIVKKLNCKNMYNAVYKGMLLGYISPLARTITHLFNLKNNMLKRIKK